MLGYRGHFSTKSRHYSTTLGLLRKTRALYRADQARQTRGLPLVDDRDAITIKEWRLPVAACGMESTSGQNSPRRTSQRPDASRESGRVRVDTVAGSPGQRVLYVVVCAAPAAAEVDVLVRLAQDAAWRVLVITSPMGRRFVDADRLADLTGEPVRSEFRMPGESNGLPAADAVIVAPATFNTINKWACGIADTFAVGLLCELMGFNVPIVAVPLLKDALAHHVAFGANLDILRSMGVRVLFDPSAPPHARMPPWERILKELHELVEN
jgi:hypothetical protein